MGIDLVFQIAAIGITVAVISLLLTRSGRDDQALLTTLAGLIVVMLMVLQQVRNLFDTLKMLFGL
ncbi:MAG: stage III sporulation protein AC [Clostridia bacterium]|nr:stage III sporulation protein AC [Clostridia bacterium]